jgi:hypothetical protein
MHKIEFNGVIKEAPAKWEELTQEQLIIWMKICAKHIEPTQALMFVSAAFCGLPKREYFRLNAAQQVWLANEFRYLLGNKLYVWIISKLNIGRVTVYQGPSDYLSTSTIDEFNAAESFYQMYRHDGNEQYLDQLIACLYRPVARFWQKNNGKDARKIFSEVDVIRNARKMQKLDKHLRAAILFNYEGCRSLIMARYPTVFIPGDGNEPAKLSNLAPLIKTVAGGKFGIYKETEQTNLYAFLDHLRDEIEESQKKK